MRDPYAPAWVYMTSRTGTVHLADFDMGRIRAICGADVAGDIPSPRGETATGEKTTCRSCRRAMRALGPVLEEDA